MPAMSAYGTKQTSRPCWSVSAFGCLSGHRSDIPKCPLLTQSGYWPVVLVCQSKLPCPESWGRHEAARFLIIDWWSGGHMAACGARVVVSTPVSAAVMQETHTIPIIFVQNFDPVGSGLVKSLVAPDGNITGFTSYEPGISSKWLELLKGVAPQVARVAIVYNPQT